MNLTFGEKLKDLREDRNLTQSQLGKILNMTQRKISYIEHDKYEPSLQDLVQICNFFNVSSDYLIGLKQHPYEDFSAK